ncbi:Dimethyladenosine transferase, partial [Friedmanniomyces endolithicus]
MAKTIRRSGSNGGITKPDPYATAAAARKGKSKTAAANNIFKMNTDIGQHILKNPG